MHWQIGWCVELTCWLAWNNFISSLSSVVCAICLMALNPRIKLLIWSALIINGTSRWHLSSLASMQRVTTVYLPKGMPVWFPRCTPKESVSSSNSLTAYLSTCQYIKILTTTHWITFGRKYGADGLQFWLGLV